MKEGDRCDKTVKKQNYKTHHTGEQEKSPCVYLTISDFIGDWIHFDLLFRIIVQKILFK